MAQWKKIVKPEESADKKNKNPKPKTPSKNNAKEKDEDDFPAKYLIDGNSKRNNTRKILYKNLKVCLKDDEGKEDLIEKVIKIEETILEKYKGDYGPYTNRVLEIIHNVKDKDNIEFRQKIVNGEIKPEDLANMDEIEMVNTKKRNEINQTIEDKVNETRSDWDEKHTKVTSGLYKCRKCGGDKTTQFEMQTRSADEPMTIFIRCVECGNSWKIQIFMINSFML